VCQLLSQSERIFEAGLPPSLITHLLTHPTLPSAVSLTPPSTPPPLASPSQVGELLSQSERIYEAGLPPLISSEADDALSDALEDLQVRQGVGRRGLRPLGRAQGYNSAFSLGWWGRGEKLLGGGGD
jgi:hypothetical protein